MPRTLRTLCTLPVALAFTLSLPSLHAQTGSPCPSSAVSDHGQSVDGKALASPAATAETSLGGKTINIHYNAPSIRCRTIMGGLVPYGKVWRTGANPATSFTTEADLMLGTLRVPAGSYTLYTLPAAAGSPWQLIISKETGQWGTVYHEAQDLGRTPMQSKTLSSPQEIMSISFENKTGNTAELHIRWEKADEWVPVKLTR